ncbi:hypothetical protein [Streptomyces sp. NPDC058475]
MREPFHHCEGSCRYDGGHFYLMDHQQRIAAAIMAAMRSAAP